MTHLAALDTAPPDAVPSLCLQLSDWLSERGDPESEGWLALGRLQRVPSMAGATGPAMWFNGMTAYDKCPHHLPRHWWYADVGRWEYESRSAALRAAAVAFVGLAEETKREILSTTMEAVT